MNKPGPHNSLEIQHKALSPAQVDKLGRRMEAARDAFEAWLRGDIEGVLFFTDPGGYPCIKSFPQVIET